MKRKLLAVNPPSTHYLSYYDLDIAFSFEEAEKMIVSAEQSGKPYDDLDLPVYDEERFWEFVKWMEKTNRKYHFSIFGARNDDHFWHIAETVRKRGFHFNS